jgi:hypothetical protein
MEMFETIAFVLLNCVRQLYVSSFPCRVGLDFLSCGRSMRGAHSQTVKESSVFVLQ